MTPDKDQNINLLPADLQRQRAVIKQIIAGAPVEYTAAPVQPFSTKLPTKTVKPPKPEPKPIPPPPTPKAEAKPAGEMFDVNLLSGEYAQAFVPQNQPFVFITSVAATALLLILSYAGIYLYQVNKESSTRSTAQINEELKKTIVSYAPLEAEDTALQKKVAALAGLLANHVSFKSFLERLEAVTIPEVTYTMIALSRSGDMSLTALATSYTALARQLTILQKDTPWVQSAIVTAASLSRDNQAHTRGVEFEISIKIDPAIFKPAEDK